MTMLSLMPEQSRSGQLWNPNPNSDQGTAVPADTLEFDVASVPGTLSLCTCWLTRSFKTPRHLLWKGRLCRGRAVTQRDTRFRKTCCPCEKTKTFRSSAALAQGPQKTFGETQLSETFHSSSCAAQSFHRRSSVARTTVERAVALHRPVRWFAQSSGGFFSSCASLHQEPTGVFRTFHLLEDVGWRRPSSGAQLLRTVFKRLRNLRFPASADVALERPPVRRAGVSHKVTLVGFLHKAPRSV